MRLFVITPLGVQVDEDGLVGVIVRRLEPDFERGSEIAFLPDHGPELVHTGDGPVRWTRSDGSTGRIDARSGFAQCAGDVVTFLTPAVIGR